MCQDLILNILNNHDLWFDATHIYAKLNVRRAVINRALRKLLQFNLIEYRVINVLRNNNHKIIEYRGKNENKNEFLGQISIEYLCEQTRDNNKTIRETREIQEEMQVILCKTEINSRIR